jgi:hypothetical protein
MRNAPRGDGWSRRQFILRGAATFAVAGFGLGGGLFARPRFDAYPFSLGVDWHGTTADGAVTLEPVYCLGNCGCGPSLLVDEDELHARVTPAAFDALVAGMRG